MESPSTTEASDSGLKEQFYRHFQEQVHSLQRQIDRLSDDATAGGERNTAIDRCLAGIEDLSHEVKDASSYLPAYDQRTYSEVLSILFLLCGIGFDRLQAIKGLSEKLQKARASFAPKAKFSFKSARKNVPVATKNGSASSGSLGSSLMSYLPGKPSSRSPQLVQDSAISPNGDESGIEDTQTASPYPSKTLIISNRHDEKVQAPRSAQTQISGITSNIQHSVIDLSKSESEVNAPLAGLHMKSIDTSLILCNQVSGPAHITDVKSSVIAVACRQFRMHKSKNVDIYLHCSSRPIIEDCEEVRFAPLPEIHLAEDISSTQNHWDQIDDFDWLKQEPSPHWSVIPTERRITETTWMDIQKSGLQRSVDEMLKAVGVLSS